jgi:hypothetical protein
MRGGLTVATEPLAAGRECVLSSWSAAAIAATGKRSASTQEVLDTLA